MFAGNSTRSGSTYYLAQGGALALSQSGATVTDCTFRDNTAVSASPSFTVPIAQGGAVWCDTPTLEIHDCLFRGNHAFHDGWPGGGAPGAQGGAVFGPAVIERSLFLENRATVNPLSLSARAEGGAVFGASLVSSCSFKANEVSGIGPIPDRGPAAEDATLTCCVFAGNLPASLPPLGPSCIVVPCDGGDSMRGWAGRR